MKRTFLLLILLLSSIYSWTQKKTTPASYMLTGRLVYKQRCMTCHQVDGLGAQNMIPPLSKTSYVLGGKSALIKIILKGMEGEIKVNGDIYAGEMPAQAYLTDKEIADVLSYVRKSFGNRASAVTLLEVKNVRSTKKRK